MEFLVVLIGIVILLAFGFAILIETRNGDLSFLSWEKIGRMITTTSSKKK